MAWSNLLTHWLVSVFADPHLEGGDRFDVSGGRRPKRTASLRNTLRDVDQRTARSSFMRNFVDSSSSFDEGDDDEEDDDVTEKPVPY